MKRIYRFIILSIIGFVVGGAMAFVAPQFMAGNFGGAYTLIDQNNNVVTDKSFGDKYKIIYFGFASCPAICPTELQKIADVINVLPASTTEKIQPIFISLDIERDTPEILKNYVAMFLPNMIGLTGSAEQINAVAKKYNVIYKKVETEGNEYTIDHSSFIYLISPSGDMVGIYKYNDPVEKITEEINKFTIK